MEQRSEVDASKVMRNTSLRPLRLSELNTPLRVKGMLGTRCIKPYAVVLVWSFNSLLAFDCSSEHGSIAKDSQNMHLPSKATWVSALVFLWTPSSCS